MGIWNQMIKPHSVSQSDKKDYELRIRAENDGAGRVFHTTGPTSDKK